MALSINRPGYAQVEAVSRLVSNSAEWWPFMRDVMQMPLSMLPTVRYAVKAGAWRQAKDPVGQLRTAAENHDKRLALGDKPVLAKGE
jgi:hypothetical protein